MASDGLDANTATVEDVQLEAGEAGEEADVFVDEEALAAEAEEYAVEEAEAVQEETGEDQGTSGLQINTEAFLDFSMPASQVEEMQKAWQLLLATSSREAIADSLYEAWFGASPSLEHLFVKPKQISAMNLFTGINAMVSKTNDPTNLKLHVTTLSYGHMHMDITEARVNIIRSAFLDMLVTSLGSRLTADAARAIESLCNYIGGAMIYTRKMDQERIHLLLDFWRQANDQETAAERMGSGGGDTTALDEAAAKEAGAKGEGETHQQTEEGSQRKGMQEDVQNVPTTFKEMFLFNSAVMGYGQNLWMNEVLGSFDNIVRNFTNVGRVQEECYVLTLRIAKVTTAGKINLSEFQSCMLASLRSLLPKVWTTEHEIAWQWCWATMEKMIQENLGKTQRWEKALVTFVESIDETTGYQMRSDFYSRFFAVSPAGEGHFKQNVTYLHLLVTKIIMQTINMYVEPAQAVDDISAIGLRHVGYGIPTELFSPYVTVMVGVIKDMGADPVSLKAFSWALSLVAQMMERTITEGSTIVMKAINANSPRALKSAISCAARGERAQWMLLITVGTRDISPFLWAVQSGAIETSQTMLEDLLTIRADRDKYYYEADYIFKRHWDIVKVVLEDAPSLLQPLLEGLIWRSRLAVNGQRRVNYYLKHLLVGPDANFAKCLQWVVAAKDPKVMVHPVLVALGDTVWDGVACRAFIAKKAWLVITLILFVVSQSVVKSLALEKRDNEGLRWAIVVLRVCIYMFSLGPMLFMHSNRWLKAYRTGDTFRLRKKFRLSLPTYLGNWQESCSLLLCIMLVAMLCTEPILYCISDDDAPMLVDWCADADDIRPIYYDFGMIGTILYFVLLRDLAVFSNHVSAYVLVAGRTTSEVALFLLAMVCVLLTWASALSCLEQDLGEFKTITKGAQAMWDMLLKMYTDQDYDALHTQKVVLTGIYVYFIVAAIFLFNLLIAQLTVSYRHIYGDMVGYARLKRSQTIVETMPSVSQKKWDTFKQSLLLDTRLEFNEGDIGIAGGIQVLEAANLHPTQYDTIKRVGGTTSVTAPWPEETNLTEGEDKFTSMENLVKKCMDQLSKKAVSKGGALGGEDSQMSGMSASEGSGAFEEGSGVEEE